MKTGKTLFWIGFVITLGVIIAYLVMMIIEVNPFTGWIASLSMCGMVLLGSVMMLMGRSLEKRDGAEV